MYHNYMRENTSARILKLALPTIASQISLTLVQVVDLIFVGQLGPLPIAAVGLVGVIFWVIQALGQGWGVGLTACIARMTGMKDVKSTALFFKTGLLTAFSFGFLLVPLLVLLKKNLLLFIQTPADLIFHADTYFTHLVLFLPFIYAFISLNAVFRAKGNAITPMIVGIAVNLLNILLDWVFIFGMLCFPKMGIKGAAIASGISYTSGAVFLFLLYLLREWNTLYKGKMFSVSFLFRIFRFSGAAAVERLAMSLSQLSIMAITVTSLGSLSIAAFNIVMRLASLSFMPGFGFAIAAATLSGQSLGEKRPDMASRYIWQSMLYCAFILLCISVLYYLFPKQLCSLFTSDLAVVKQTQAPLRVYAVMAVFLAPTMVFGGGLRGAGDTVFTMVLMFLSRFLIRIPFSWVFGIFLNLHLSGVWLAMCLDFVIRGFVFMIRIRQGRWKKIKV